MEETGVKAAVREFLGTLCSVDGIGDDDDIFADGFVNSLYLVQVLAFVQKTFSVTVEDDDLDMANFRTLQAIADFVGRKKAGG